MEEHAGFDETSRLLFLRSPRLLAFMYYVEANLFHNFLDSQQSSGGLSK